MRRRYGPLLCFVLALAGLSAVEVPSARADFYVSACRAASSNIYRSDHLVNFEQVANGDNDITSVFQAGGDNCSTPAGSGNQRLAGIHSRTRNSCTGGVSSCVDPEARQNSFAVNVFDIGNPYATGRQIVEWQAHLGFRSSSTNTTNTSFRYQWNAYMFATRGGAVQSVTSRNLTNGIGNVTACNQRDQTQCYGATDGYNAAGEGEFFSRNELGGADGQPIYQVGGAMTCGPANCVDFGGGAVEYAGRVNMYSSNIRVQDNIDPSVNNVRGCLWDCTYLRGTQGLYYNVSDNSGARLSFTHIDGSPTAHQIQDHVSSCNTTDEMSNRARYYNAQACANVADRYMDLNTAALGDGAHTVRITGVDPAARQGAVQKTIITDNSDPVASGSPAPTAGCDLAVSTPPATANAWIRGVIRVGGEACDPTSGITASVIQASVNGGTWFNLGNCSNSTAGPNATATPECDFDSNPYSEGSTVVFRTVAFNGAGGGGVSGATPVRRIDNAAPTVNGLAFAPTNASWVDSKRWTNGGGPSTGYRTPTDASWNVSPGSGSPIANTFTRYTPGPSCAVNATRTYGGARTTEALANDPSASCGQGAHRLAVWARDEAGNESNSNYDGVYHYDSVAPAKPTGASANPSSWTSTNSFSISWTNPRYDNIVQSPNQTQFSRFPQSDTDPAGTSTSCRGDGAACTVNGLVIPGSPTSGIYKYKLWYSDAAGNANESSNSVTVNLYYENNSSDPVTGNPCVIK